MTDFTDVSQESAREAVANVAMTIRAMATGLQLRSEFDGSMGQSLNSVANEYLEWASRLERAVRLLDAEKARQIAGRQMITSGSGPSTNIRLSPRYDKPPGD